MSTEENGKTDQGYVVAQGGSKSQKRPAFENR